MLKTILIAIALMLATLTAPVLSPLGYPGPAEAAGTPARVFSPGGPPSPLPSPLLITLLTATPDARYECVGYIQTDYGEICAGWLYWGDGTPMPPTDTPPMAYP